MSECIKTRLIEDHPDCTLLENGNIQSNRHSDAIYVPIVFFQDNTWKRLSKIDEGTKIFALSEKEDKQRYPFCIAVYMENAVDGDVTDDALSTEMSYWDDD